MGAPVGIVRAERNLALWAYLNVPSVAFVFFDPSRQAYCEITRDVRQFLTGEAALDTLGLTNSALPGKRRTDQIPGALKPAFLWIVQTRRIALNRLERIRLETQRPWLARLADYLQRRLMSVKYRHFMVREDKTRRAFFPYEMAVGAHIKFGPNDTLVCAGSGWNHTNINAIDDLESKIRFRLVLLCHDIIPLMFSQFYRNYDVDLFRNYMHRSLAIADHIVVTSRRVEADCRAYCMQHNIIAGDITVGALGFDVSAVRPELATKLPAGLRQGLFAMLVGTIEPRKGHRLLYQVWRRLVSEGVPQASGFKLVFVGRPGWMVDELLAEIKNDSRLAEQLLIIDDADDDLLTTLYQSAAFCAYPSIYEGYGLPVIEAFSFGKAVLASTGGALPELVQGFSPCIDPTDELAWYEKMKEWIESPQARIPYEDEIRIRFRHPTWSEAAASFFRSISATKET